MIILRMNIGQAVAKRVNDLIKQHKTTQYRLAIDTSITHNTMTNIVNAKTKSVNLKTIFLICRELNITIDKFFDDPVFKNADLEIE